MHFFFIYYLVIFKIFYTDYRNVYLLSTQIILFNILKSFNFYIFKVFKLCVYIVITRILRIEMHFNNIILCGFSLGLKAVLSVIGINTHLQFINYIRLLQTLIVARLIFQWNLCNFFYSSTF